MNFTPEQKNDLRQRVLRGERLDLDTCRKVIEDLRQARFGAATAAAASTKKKSTRKGISDEQLDKELDAALFGLGDSGATAATGGDSAPDIELP